MKTFNNTQFLVFLGIVLLLGACAPKVNIPYYTRVENMTKLKPGQSLNQVNTMLGVKPYDIYLDFAEGKKIVVYKYKRRYQKVNTRRLKEETSLSNGMELYRDEGEMYCVFAQNKDKLLFYVTDLGRQSGKNSLLNEGKLKLYVNSPETLRESKSRGRRGKKNIVGDEATSLKKGKLRSRIGSESGGCMYKGCFGQR